MPAPSSEEPSNHQLATTPAPAEERMRLSHTAMGHTGQPGRVVLTQAQHLASDPDYSRANPRTAAMNAWRNPYQTQNRLGYKLGRWLRPYLYGGNRVGGILDKGALPGAGIGAGMGAIGGLLGHLLLSASGGLGLRSPGLAHMLGLGGGTGGLLGGVSGHFRTRPKAASYRGMPIPRANQSRDPRAEVLAALSAAPMPFGDKSRMMAGVSQLSARDIARLQRVVSTASGGMIGALVMRFLLGRGLGGTLLGAAVGGLLGSRRF